MCIRGYYRSLTCAICVILAVAAAIALRPPIGVDGPILDLVVWLRSIAAPEGTPKTSPVAVVALDRRSLDAPELANFPRALMYPQLAEALTAVLGAGARAVGFDEIFSYDPARLPGVDPTFDASFLAALRENRSRIVLARSAGMLPAQPFAFSVGYDAIGLTEVRSDPDGRYRRVDSSESTADGKLPTFVKVLLDRARLAMPAVVLIVPRAHLERIPTYALVDVLRCAKESPAALVSAFDGKIVLFGGTIAEEDRKVTAGRFLAPAVADSTPLAPCGLRTLGASAPASSSVPGVFLHAAAVEAVATGQLVQTATPLMVALIGSITAALGAGSALLLAPWTAAILVVIFGAVLVTGAACALNFNLWIPIAVPLYALAGAPMLSYIVRYLVEERTRRHLVHAFGHYLSPAIVEQLAADPAALKLGGERREVTVMFADLSGFTVMSSVVSPEVLIATVNRYLGYVVKEIEESGGYVDKFVGDAVMALWGAPVRDEHHATSAVRCATRATVAVARAFAEDEARGEPGFSVKIGINSGLAVVGNVGTEHRYAYTAHGEMVNLGSRLESVPPHYNCTVVVGPRTAELVRNDFLLRELDWILVKGGREPMAIYQPIGEIGRVSDQQLGRERRFADALAHYRAARFDEAASIWEDLFNSSAASLPTANGDPEKVAGPESVMALRARQFLIHPPPQPWNAVNELSVK